MTKNLKGKTRKQDNPYSIYKSYDGWEWRILKHYQSSEKEKDNPFARVFCAVRSPYTYGSFELGDVYIADIISNAEYVEGDKLEMTDEALLKKKSNGW